MSQSAALFGRPQQPQAKHLLQFKAGKMTKNNANWVHPDHRKGWVYIYQSGDGKLHFCWIDRKTCLVENDFIIGAQQAEFRKVSQCTTGRVYLLKFKNSTRFFIWMQEANGKNDNNICSRINEFITSPPSPFTAPSTDWLSGLSGFSHLSHSDLLAFLSMGVGLSGGISSESDISSAQATTATVGRHLNTGHLESQANPTSVLGSAITTPQVAGRPRLPTTQSGGKRNETGKFQSSDLREILSSISGAAKEPSVDLNDAINMESVRELLAKPEVQARLLPHLPATDPEAKPASDSENLITNVRSSQFKSTLKSFSAAFQTGDLAPVLAQFKLGGKADEAAKRGDLLAFAQALQGGNSAATAPTSAGLETVTCAPGSSLVQGEQPKSDQPTDPKQKKKEDMKEETKTNTDGTAMDTD